MSHKPHDSTGSSRGARHRGSVQSDLNAGLGAPVTRRSFLKFTVAALLTTACSGPPSQDAAKGGKAAKKPGDLLMFINGAELRLGNDDRIHLVDSQGARLHGHMLLAVNDADTAPLVEGRMQSLYSPYDDQLRMTSRELLNLANEGYEPTKLKGQALYITKANGYLLSNPFMVEIDSSGGITATEVALGQDVSAVLESRGADHTTRAPHPAIPSPATPPQGPSGLA